MKRLLPFVVLCPLLFAVLCGVPAQDTLKATTTHPPRDTAKSSQLVGPSMGEVATNASSFEQTSAGPNAERQEQIGWELTMNGPAAAVTAIPPMADSLAAALAKTEGELKAAHKAVDDLKVQLVLLESEKRTGEARKNKLQQHHTRVKSISNGHLKLLSLIGGKSGDIYDQFNKLEDRFVQLQDEATTFAKDLVDEQDKRLADLAGKIVALNGEIKKASERVSVLEGQVELLRRLL
jgi:hypothetical protein